MTWSKGLAKDFNEIFQKNQNFNQNSTFVGKDAEAHKEKWPPEERVIQDILDFKQDKQPSNKIPLKLSLKIS